MKATLNNIVDSLMSDQSRSQVFLQRTRKLDPANSEDSKILELMNNPSFRDRITGHLLNLMTSGERGVFCISVRSLCNSIKDDPNWKRKAKMNKNERRIAFGILRAYFVDEIVAFDMKASTPGVYRIKNALIREFLNEKLEGELAELEVQQEYQCLEWIEQRKESRAEQSKTTKKLRPIVVKTACPDRSDLDIKLKRRIAEDVLLASVAGQPIAGRSRAVMLACRDVLEMKKEDVPMDVFDSYDEYQVTECKSAMREAFRISLNHWLDTAKPSELETHHQLCELVQAHAEILTRRKKRSEIRLSYDLAECSNKMLLQIAFDLFGIKPTSNLASSPFLTAVV